MEPQSENGSSSLDDLESPAMTPLSEGSGSSGTEPRQPRLPKRWLYIGGAALVLVALLAGLVLIVHKPAAKKPQTIVINTQSLDNGTLNKVTAQLGKDSKVQQQLTIAPNTLFKNDVNVQKDLSVEGNFSVKGTSNLLGAVATGSNLAVGGGLSVSRNAAVGGSLSVSGAITAGSLNVGSINLSTMSLSGNFSWGGHLISTGTSTTASSGVAIGNGRVTVSGNDSIGQVAITAGTSGLLANGEFAIIRFHNAYGGTPKVQLTPADQGAAALQYYVVSAPGFFSIRSVSAPSASAPYTFNYFVSQ
jgi:hypothetical protein